MNKKVKINISDERHDKELESIGSIFMPIVKDMINNQDLIESDVIFNWYDIVGKTVAQYTNPIKVKYDTKQNKRIIHIEVPIGGFALELVHKEKYLIEKINNYFGYNAIHGLKINQSANFKIKQYINENKKEKEIVLDENEQKYLSEVTSSIKNDKLKEILTKLGESIIKSKKEGK